MKHKVITVDCPTKRGATHFIEHNEGIRMMTDDGFAEAPESYFGVISADAIAADAIAAVMKILCFWSCC